MSYTEINCFNVIPTSWELKEAASSVRSGNKMIVLSTAIFTAFILDRSKINKMAYVSIFQCSHCATLPSLFPNCGN